MTDTATFLQFQIPFPSFYAEVAYRDGYRDQTEGHCNSVPSYMRHGEFEPVGYGWYLRGRKAAQPSSGA